MSKLADLIVEIIQKVSKDYWPPEGAPVRSVEIELLYRPLDILFSSFSVCEEEHKAGYRVRKVERFDDHRFKKYGLSWMTGEWILIQQGKGYPGETFLEIKEP